MINPIAPHWDGNQVWLVTAAGALFAAWPMVYAAAFSGFYVAMILVHDLGVGCLILPPARFRLPFQVRVQKLAQHVVPGHLY